MICLKILGFKEDKDGVLRRGIVDVDVCKLRECINKNNCRNCTVRNVTRKEKNLGHFECHTLFDSVC